jgi:hypothetical protein
LRKKQKNEVRNKSSRINRNVSSELVTLFEQSPSVRFTGVTKEYFARAKLLPKKETVFIMRLV